MSSLPIDSPLLPAAAMPAVDDPLEWRLFSEPVGAQADPAVRDATAQARSSQIGPQVASHIASHIALEGMTCAACANIIEDALRRVPGVSDAQVDSATARARVVWHSGVTSPSRWLAAVEQAGYRGVPAPDALAHADVRRERRRLLWRWLVAGFCMMQVMMYAYPVYIAQPGEMTDDARALLLWASWVLSLPVVMFSCTPFISSAWRDLRQRQIGMDVPVALGIVITFVVSSAVTFGAGPAWGHEVWFDSLTMFVFFLLSGRWLELRLRERTTGSLDELTRRLPQTVRRLRADSSADAGVGAADHVEEISARRLSVGDRLQVLPGEAFAADGRIVAGRTHVDEALLTGESTALPRGPGDAVLAGSHNLTHPVQVEVVRLGADTRYGEIVSLVERAGFDKPAIAALADRMARPFLVAVLIAAGLAFAWWWPQDPSRAWAAAVAVLIVTCPCALSLATPAAMIASAGSLARMGVLVRGLRQIEALATVDTIVFDKTGTLTQEQLQLSRIDALGALSPQQALALAATVASASLHPVSRALVGAAAAQGVAHGVPAAGAVEEVMGRGLRISAAALAACLTDTQRAADLREAQAGAALLHGEVRLGSPAWCGQPAAQDEHAPRIEVMLCDARGPLARFALDEMLRPDARQAVDALSRLGVAAQILSGDSSAAASRVAMKAGLVAARGDCAPDAKLRHVRALQQAGHRVAMVGDGLNDAPVLASANVSFAMGHAAPLAQSRADFVVQASRLMDIAHAVALARRTLRVVRQNLAWAAAYNAVSVPLAIVGWMPAWAAGLGMAASSLLVVANAARLSRPQSDSGAAGATPAGERG